MTKKNKKNGRCLFWQDCDKELPLPHYLSSCLPQVLELHVNSIIFARKHTKASYFHKPNLQFMQVFLFSSFIAYRLYTGTSGSLCHATTRLYELL